MSREQILELALEAACDKWAEYRFLAGLDASEEGANWAYKTNPAELKRNEELMYEWSRNINYLRDLLTHNDAGLYYETLTA